MPRVASIKRESLAERAMAVIRAAVRDGGLEQGRIYSEAELSELMGVSRTPVREALIQLAREGLIEILPQRGFRLRSLSRDDIQEVFAIRLALERLVVEQLSTRATPADTEQLRQLLQRQEEVISDSAEFLAVDEAFHLVMPKLLGLGRVHDLLVSVRGMMLLMGSVALTVRDRAPHVLAEHTAIVKAIEDGDPQAASEAIATHIRSTLAAVEAEARTGSLL